MTLLQAIINRDECSVSEAMDLIRDMVAQYLDGEDPEEILLEEGFEPDYFFDLLDYVEND